MCLFLSWAAEGFWLHLSRGFWLLVCALWICGFSRSSLFLCYMFMITLLGSVFRSQYIRSVLKILFLFLCLTNVSCICAAITSVPLCHAFHSALFLQSDEILPHAGLLTDTFRPTALFRVYYTKGFNSWNVQQNWHHSYESTDSAAASMDEQFLNGA